MMKVVKKSHTDHGLTARQMVHLIFRYQKREGFFIDTFELPERLGTVPAELYGPSAGDPPVEEADVTYVYRGDRDVRSRTVNRPARTTRLVTVIAGPLGDEPCALYTVYGGACAPREPEDTSITDANDLMNSELFWKQHALCSKPDDRKSR